MPSPVSAQLPVRSAPVQLPYQRGLNILENNRRQPIKQKIFLQAQQNLAKMLLGDDFFLLMYLCKSPMR